MNDNFHVWEGIYKNFNKVPVVGGGHEGQKWLEVSVERAKKLLEESNIKGAVSEAVGFHENLLPFLATIVSAENSRVTILDFGGALGISYIPTKAAMIGKTKLDFHIIELMRVVREGRKLFKKDPNIHFHSDLPKIPNRADIVNIGSSIQYVQDWQGMLKRLTEYRPKYFNMTQIFTGNIPTYATLQNYYDSKIAFWFINFKELVSVMAKLDYRLIFKARFYPVFLGIEQEYPQDNFPPKFRLKRSCNLLFVKNENI